MKNQSASGAVVAAEPAAGAMVVRGGYLSLEARRNATAGGIYRSEHIVQVRINQEDADAPDTEASKTGKSTKTKIHGNAYAKGKTDYIRLE
jgi:hypothetical protein